MKKYNDGMAKPMADRDFWVLMTTDAKGLVSPKLVTMTLKYYPELAVYNV